MEYLQLIVYIFITMRKVYEVNAGLLDPITNIFNPQEHNNGAIGSLLSPLLGNAQRSRLRQYNEINPANGRSWLNVDHTLPSSNINNIFKDTTKSPDYDLNAAKHFPEGVALLEKLKELNKLKESQKLKNEESKIDLTSKDTVDSRPNKIDNHNKSNDYNREPTNKENKGILLKEDTKEDKPKTDGVIKAITIKQFYFQVQPVRPLGESNVTNETIYYVDA